MYFELFLEQPVNKIIMESETATFRCQLSNSSYTIHWIVNNSAANFRTFQENGVSVLSINVTTVYLQIIGYRSNNNTVVQCAGRLFENHRIIDYVSSGRALLVIHEYRNSSTVESLQTTSHKYKSFYNYYAAISIYLKGKQLTMIQFISQCSQR